MKFIKRLQAISLLLLLVGYSIITQMPQASAVTAGADQAPTGECKGLGLDVSEGAGENIQILTKNDFRVTALSRTQILVEAADPSKPFFKNAASPSLGDIIGSGCIISDINMDDDYQWQEPKDSMISFDAARSDGGSFGDQSDDVHFNLGVIDTSGLSIELNWIFFTGSGWIGLTDKGWLEQKNVLNGMDLISGETALVIDNVIHPENFNHTLKLSGQPGSLKLTRISSKDPTVFSEGVDNNGNPILLKNISNPDDDFIGFGPGVTPESLAAASGFVDMLYYDNFDDTTPATIKVLGGAGQAALEGAVPADASGGAESIGEGGDNCESLSDFAFSFVLCPILALTDTAIGWLDNRIISSLTIKEAYYNNPQLKESWGNVRNVAYVVLIPIMLVMVIGTAMGGKFMDAYTVKRAMPRLFIAAIFIALSFDITGIMVQMTNGIGAGVAGLISAPFGGVGELTLQDLFDPSVVNNGLFIGGVLGGLTVAAFSGVTIWVLFSFIGTAALGMLIIFILLSVRELLVIFLMVISPLAILAWIFPGNDKPWKLWWQTFSKLLLLFPIIMGVMATGRVFAHITNDVYKAEGVESIVGVIVKLVTIIGPYFFIPKLFQMAGGAFANAAGMMNDRTKGFFDRQRKFRENQRKDAKHRIKSGNRFRNAPEGSTRAKLNKALQSGSQLPDAGFRPSRIKAAKRLHAAHELDNINKDPGAMSVLANDDAANALMSGRGTRDDMIKYLISSAANGGSGYDPKDAAQIADELMLLSRTHGVESMKQAGFIQLAGSKTAYRGGPAEMLNAAYEAAGGDTQVAASLYAKARSAAEQAGRVDLAGYSYGEGLVEAQKIWGARAQGMSATEVDGVANDVNTRLLNKVVDSKGAGALVSSHGTSVKNLTTIMNDRLTNANANLNDAQANLERVTSGGGSAEEINVAQEAVYTARDNKAAALAEAANAYDSIAYVSPENAREFRDNVLNQQATGYKKVMRPAMNTVQRARNDGSGITDTIQIPALNDDGTPQYTEVIVERDGQEPLQAHEMVSVQEAMEANRSNEVFRKTRREHSMTEEEMRRRGPTGTGTGMPGII